jgi:hypothetical protein
MKTNGRTQKETIVPVQQKQGGGDILDIEIPTTST